MAHQSRPIRTLVVDDSVFMRTVLKSALTQSDNIEVVGTAQNGQEALKKIAQLKPDVITLDIEMPGLDGLAVLKRIMADDPRPVVMVSTKTQEGAQLTFEALELGAVDYVAKPLADRKASLQRFRQKVVHAVEMAFESNRSQLGPSHQRRVLPPRKVKILTKDFVVAIGISVGGPATLHQFIPLLPKEFPPIVLTQHMPAEFTGPFAKRLDEASDLNVKEAQDGDELIKGRILLARGDRHLRVVRRGARITVALDAGPKVAGFRPSVDAMFESVAKTFGANALGLVMTGMGCDGADGVRAMKKAGARVLAQDQASSIVYGMPKAAYQTGCIDEVVPLAAIPDTLVRLLSAREPVSSR